MNCSSRLVPVALLGFFVSNALSSTLETPSVTSAVMKKAIPVTVILPDSYQSKPASLPVLYLLHGAGDNQNAWAAKTTIKELADEYGIMVVCPDAGSTSWYIDSPEDPTYQYETFTAKELPAYIDSHYHTEAVRQSRAIAGLSMGGHGALYLATRHKDVFSVAVVLSGGVDLRPFPNNWDIAKRLGTIEAHPQRWDENSVVNVVKTLHPGDLAIAIDCGVDDFFSKVNRDLHAELLTMKIPHDYTERPGGHSWDYWGNAIKFQMVFISEAFKKAEAANAQSPH